MTTSHKYHLKNSTRFWLFLSVGLFIFIGCGGSSPAGPGKIAIQIFVRDESTQYLLTNAKVRIRIDSLSSSIIFPLEQTDDNGLAVFSVGAELIDELATIEVELEGYQLHRQQITLRNAMGMDVPLVPMGVTLMPTLTLTATITPQVDLVETTTLEPTETVRPSVTPTATGTMESTATFTPVSTNRPTPSLTPSHTPSSHEEPTIIATALISSSIFEEPNSGSAELTFINPGERVIVLEDQGSWILVRNDAGIEGWSAANRFDITLGTPTPVPVIMAVVIESASIFEAPDSESSEITFLNPGDEVRVLGRTTNSAWLFIRTELNVEGWVAANRLELSVSVEKLPIVDVTVTNTSTDEATDPSGNITLDFWSLPGQASCSGGVWTITLFLEAQGGDAPYTYYVGDELVAGSAVGSVTKQFSGADSTSRIYRARVITNSGLVVTKEILVTPPDCN